ncbi:MAG: DegV family protein [Erysipelotrichaceae bacterium]|nr:DegV family protein [Erysipelotrichaceae bacterium]
MNDYVLITDAASGLSPEEIDIIPMPLEIDEKEYFYGGEDMTITAEAFYQKMKDGAYPSTSQVSPSVYTEHFERFLKEGKDILYLGFSSGLSGTLQSSVLAKKILRDDYPDRKIYCIDTLCASAGEGYLVREAMKKKEEGYSYEELLDFVETHKRDVAHWFTIDTLDYLEHGGRIPAAAASLGALLHIKPVLSTDEEGKLTLVSMPRGKKKAVSLMLSRMEEEWDSQMGNKVFIGHADDLPKAEELENLVKEHFPEADTEIVLIDPVIASHVGPGMLAMVYWRKQS